MAQEKPIAPLDGAQRGRALEQVVTSASTIFLLLIVLMLNYLAFRHYKRLDWTSDGMFTLSPKSVSIVEGLRDDLTVYLFMSQGEPSFESTDELLKRYRAISEHVKVRYVDPDREPAEFKILAQRFGILEGVTMTGEVRADVAAVVERGEKRWHVDRDDLVAFDLGPMDDGGGAELNVKAEQALTGAFVQVTSGRATEVCVTSGHGEWSLDEADERSLVSLQAGLRHDNLEWEALETLGKTEVPKGCDSVLVLGPTRAFSEAEAKLLLGYAKSGGNLLLALDPVIEHDVVQPTGFEAALEELSVRLDRSLVIELSPEHLLSPNTVEFLVTEFGDHPTTSILRGRARVLISLSRSLSLLTQTDRVEPILRSSPKAFAALDIARVMTGQEEPTRATGDREGPIDLAYVVRVSADDEPEQKGHRLIVLGDSDFLQPALLEAPELANFHLASSLIGFLTQRDALIEIPPKKVKGGAVMFTQEDLGALLFKVGVLIPGAAFLLGLAVWLNRRS
jgi:hypothetical protein